MTETVFAPGRDKIIRYTIFSCLLGLGGFVAWAAVAPLEEGVAASGQVIVESERQVVQHLEGGIISDIKVRDGEWVEQGDVLVVLENIVSLAGRDQVIQEYAALAASTARLQALLDGDAEPDFSDMTGLDLGQQERADIISRERSLFAQQRRALAADVLVLTSRSQAAAKTEAARLQQAEIVERSLDVAQGELALMQDMRSRQLVRLDQVSRAERLVAELEGDIARLEADASAAASSRIDLDAQIDQARAQFSRQLSTEFLETRASLLSAEERLRAAQNVLDRSVILAPVSGEVLNLAFSTIGGVVRPGEAVMEIVPNIGEVTASVRIRPNDRNTVFEGQTVRTQFTSYSSWSTPRLDGKVIDVSADLKTDPVTSAGYYEARIR
ncbi:MAG: HlyD family type I secretion periplasmic adaptor subunit, partial [Pseudomonadota bacterium]